MSVIVVFLKEKPDYTTSPWKCPIQICKEKRHQNGMQFLGFPGAQALIEHARNVAILQIVNGKICFRNQTGLKKN